MRLKLIYERTLKLNSQINTLVLLSSYGLIGYTNSSYAGNFEDHKLVIGYCFCVNKAIVSWYSKKQHAVSISIIKADYIAFGYAA